MPQTEMSSQEIARRGWDIYLKEIRPQVIDQHRGEFLMVDVESGDYAIGKSLLAAEDILKSRHPEGRFYGIRIGYRAAYTIGGALPPDELPNAP